MGLQGSSSPVAKAATVACLPLPGCVSVERIGCGLASGLGDAFEPVADPLAAAFFAPAQQLADFAAVA